MRGKLSLVCMTLSMFVLLFGCREKATKTEGLYSPLADGVKLKELENEIHLSLPRDTALVKATGLDPRDETGVSSRELLLYSQSGFAVTPDKLISARNLAKVAEFAPEPTRDLQSWLGVELPTVTCTSVLSWETDSAVFTAWLEETEKGDFLRIKPIGLGPKE